MTCCQLGTAALTQPMPTFVIQTPGNMSYCHVVWGSDILMPENKIETTFL